MKKLFLLMVILVLSMTFLIAQTIAEYTYSTSTTGSLVDMSSGTTDLLATGVYRDSDASAVINIGFNFKLGDTYYTQFSINSNGQMQLGATAISGATAAPAANTPRLAPISGDNAIRATGKVHYKVTGAVGTRKLIVEWVDLRVPYGSAVETGTYCNMQAVLYETSNKVEFIYGTMYNMGTSASARGIYISTSNIAGSVGNVTTIITTPTWTVTGTIAVTTSFPLNSAMTNLNSSADGSRRVFTFEAPLATVAPNAPILVMPTNNGWSFINGVLSWTPGSTAGGAYVDNYDVYLDTVDGSTPVSTYQFGTTYTPTLAAGTTYYWKVVARNNIGTTSSAVWNFKTAGANQLAESFENTTFPPLGWSNPGTFTRSTTTPFHLTAGAYKSTAAAAMLYTPMLQLTATSELNFMARSAATTGIGRIQIKYSSDGVTWNPIGDIIAMPTNSTWNNYVVDLSSLAGNNYMLGFEVYSSTTTSTTFYIDYVFGPDFAALTPEPATVVYPANAGWSFLDATLKWAGSASGGIPTSYDVYFGTSVTPPFVVNQTGTTYTPTLAANTTYYWQIVPRNDSGAAEGCPIWSFKTPTATQLAESFEVVTPFLPAGWANPGTWSGSTTSPYHGARNAYKSASTTPAILSTPVLTINSTSTLDFYYRTAATTGYGMMNIKYSTDRVNWTQIGATIPMPITTTWNYASVALGAIPAGNYYLAFEVLTSTSTASIYIDHVVGPDVAAVAPGPVALTAPADLAMDIAIRPTFTWTAPALGGVPTGYKVYCDTNVNPYTEIADVTGLTFTATAALAYSTVYYWKVVAYNTTGSSVINTVRSFGTVADPTITTMPWLENFGTTGTTFPPTNWTRWSGLLTPEPVTLTTSTGYWLQDDFANIVTSPVNFSAKINIYSTTWKYWLITPPIQMPGAGYQLEFDIALTDYTNALPPDDPAGLSGIDDKFVVLISDGSSWSTANAVKVWDNDDLTNGGIYEVYNAVPHTGSHWVLPLDSYTGIKHIAFYGESTISNADNDFFVDNVRIRLGGQAPLHVTLNSPADLAIVDPDNVLLSWTQNAGGGAPAWYEVYVGANPIDPANDYYGEYLYEPTTNSLDLDAQGDIVLGYNTTWYWAVLPYNEFGSPAPTGMTVRRFTTMPDPTITVLPHVEYFDSVTAPALPYGWSAVVQASTTSAYVNTLSSTTYAVSAPNSARLYNSTDIAANLLLIPPDFSMALNTIKVRLFARSSTAGEDLYIGAYNPLTEVFTQIGAVMDLTTTQTQYTVPLSSYVGTDTFIAFKHGVGTSTRTIYIDNVEFIQMVANDLAATTLTGTNYLQAGFATDYVVTVFNEGTASQSAYTVNLVVGNTTVATLNVTTPLAAGASAQHTLTWTPATGGIFQIFGQVVLAGDQVAANNTTATKEVYVVDASMTLIPVGDDATTTSSTMLPVDMYYRNSVTEELYFTDEMHLQSGTITALVYKNTFLNNRPGKALKIWMAHTTVTDLSGGWLPAVNYTLVFDGTVDFPAGINYVVIPLDTPFNYTGGTIATRFYRVFDSGTLSSSDKFFYTTNPAHTVRSRYLRNDTTVYDPMAPSAAGTTLGYFPNTTFVVQNAIMEQSAKISGHVYILGSAIPIPGATVTLTDERYSTTTNADGYYEFTFWEAHTVSAYAAKANYYNSATVTGIALTMGNTVTQNFSLIPYPQITFSGMVTSNDYPTGLEGATVKLFGYANYETTTAAGGTFSIAGVYGTVDGLIYTVTASKDGYQSFAGEMTAYAANLNYGTINLIEYLWTPYELVATHSGDNAQLTWEAAAAPEYYFSDFESDNGGWTISASWGTTGGDWEWTDSYNVANFVDTYGSGSVVPPPTAHSGDGMWGTKINTNHTNANGWSYLTKTFDLAGYDTPQLRFWRWNNLFYTYDYYFAQVSTDGTNWTNVVSESAISNVWMEKVADLTAYSGQTVQIRFAMFSTSAVNYAGIYIDDVYVGNPPILPVENERWLLNYDVYRFLAADEANPANWTLLQSGVTGVTYLDTGFGALPAGSYKWAVKANYSGALQSDAIISNALGVIDTPLIDEPTIGVVGNNVTFGWQAQPGATYYTLYGSGDPYAVWPWTIIAYSATPSFTFNAGTIPFKFFKVTASDGVMPSQPARNR